MERISSWLFRGVQSVWRLNIFLNFLNFVILCSCNSSIHIDFDKINIYIWYTLKNLRMIFFLINLIFKTYSHLILILNTPFVHPLVILHGLLFGAPVLGPWCANMLSVTWAQQHPGGTRQNTGQPVRANQSRQHAGGQGHLASTLREKPTVSR